MIYSLSFDVLRQKPIQLALSASRESLSLSLSDSFLSRVFSTAWIHTPNGTTSYFVWPMPTCTCRCGCSSFVVVVVVGVFLRTLLPIMNIALEADMMKNSEVRFFLAFSPASLQTSCCVRPSVLPSGSAWTNRRLGELDFFPPSLPPDVIATASTFFRSSKVQIT